MRNASIDCPLTQVIAITGGKGGIGKTNIAVNIGAILSRLGKKVCLLDADFGLPNVDIILGLNPKLTLENVFNHECSLQEAIIHGPFGLRVIPGAAGTQKLLDMNAKDYAGFIDSFNHLTEKFETLIIDTASGISESVARFAVAAHEIVVVVCDEPSSLMDAYCLMKTLNQRHGVYRFRIVVNLSGGLQHARHVYGKLNTITNKYLDIVLSFAGWIPDDPFLRKAVKQQTAVVESYPSSKSALSFYQISETLCKMPVPMIEHGNTQFFMNQHYKINNTVN